jgi:hypothetical protein
MNSLLGVTVDINQPAGERALRIASRLQALRDAMPYPSFLAWYVTTSLDDEKLEAEIERKMKQLGV